MEVVIRDSQSAVAVEAAGRVIALVQSAPASQLGLATGATQQGIYQLLIDAHRSGVADFSSARYFMLDEYVGIPVSSSTSFQNVLSNDFLRHVQAPDGALEVLDGNAPDLEHETHRFEVALGNAGGVDLQLLGIGTNGHIGFNEPGSSAESRTRVVELHTDTIHSNAHYFESAESVPRCALSQGIGTILEARSILLIATGESKARAIAAMVEGPATEDCPASLLQKHPNVTVIIDTAAASMLRTREKVTTRAQASSG